MTRLDSESTSRGGKTLQATADSWYTGSSGPGTCRSTLDRSDIGLPSRKSFLSVGAQVVDLDGRSCVSPGVAPHVPY